MDANEFFAGLFKEVGTLAAQQQAARERDPREASAMANAYTEAACQIIAKDRNARFLVVTSVPYGDGKQELGFATGVGRMGENKFYYHVLTTVMLTMAHETLTLRGRLRLAWKVLFGKPITEATTLEDAIGKQNKDTQPGGSRMQSQVECGGKD